MKCSAKETSGLDFAVFEKGGIYLIVLFLR